VLALFSFSDVIGKIINVIVIIFTVIMGIILAIIVLILLLQLALFIWYGLGRVFYKLTARPRQRRAILNSLSDSENSSFQNPDSLYEQSLHLAAGIKNADENKLRLRKYQKRMVIQLEKTTNSPELEASKKAYLEKHAASIAKAKAQAKKRGDESFDIDSNPFPIIIWSDSNFEFPDFGDFSLDLPDFNF
jgi:hypothetical protein